MGIVLGMMLILMCQLLGEALVLLFDLLIPGPVIGMLLLFGILLIRGHIPASLDQASSALLNHLALFFVPAGVGVMLHWQHVGKEWMPIAVALLLSAVITLAVTALIMKVMMILFRKPSAYDGK
ncbi:MAG: CidA/LrgA family protein [Candidatus Competibacteraceae bacterium]|nr:CidA/LrgA family protein [Candidatus Competibacteraceae bacterium]